MIDFDNAHIDEFAALLAVAREGTFVAAGRALERHASIVSKRIAALEQRLGVRLIERTTRRVRLTETGSQLVDKLRVASSLIQDAEQAASRDASELRGNLRIALPTAMGRQWVAPLLPAFLKRYPALQVEVNYSERYIDLVAEGYDAAVRIGVLRDSRLVARKLADHQRILCASPEYLAQHGVPTSPADLTQHNCLAFQGFASYPAWHLSNGAQTESVLARGSLRSNDNSALLEAARAGVGILGAGEWLMAQDLAAGTLLRVLPDWAFDVDGGIYLVRPSAQFTPARTTAFIDWIREQFRSNIPWGRAAANEN